MDGEMLFFYLRVKDKAIMYDPNQKSELNWVCEVTATA